MKKKWLQERIWDVNNTELVFEKLVKENGFEIIGYKGYLSKTDYLISKNGIEMEWGVYSIDNSKKRGELCFKLFNESYGLKVELLKLKNEMKEM